jgi:hypothetical protein
MKHVRSTAVSSGHSEHILSDELVVPNWPGGKPRKLPLSQVKDYWKVFRGDTTMKLYPRANKACGCFTPSRPTGSMS